MGGRYWLIIYNPPRHIDICRQHRLISFNTHNRQAMSRFRQMAPGDVALVKHAGAHIFTDVWRVTSHMRPNPNDSEPWASQGDLRGREFTYIAEIEVLEVFKRPKELPGRLSDFISPGKIGQCRAGLVELDRDEFCGLYEALTGRSCPY